MNLLSNGSHLSIRPRKGGVRLRTWMVAVAVVALALGAAATLRARSRRFQALADFHRARIQSRFATPNRPGGIRLLSIDSEGRPLSREAVDRDIRDAVIARLYERAARRPWAPGPAVGR